MKVCPRCQKTYTDDNLNFCLEDGSVLSQAGNAPMPDTVLINQPRATTPNQPGGQPSGSQPGAAPAWGSAPQPYSMQPAKKSSKTWIWVLLIFGVLALVCGGGFVGFFAFVASQDTNRNTYDSTPSPTASPKPTSTTTGTNTGDRTDVQEIDLSKWVQDFSVYGNTEFSGTEFIMSSKQKAYYYVLVAPKEYGYDKADVRVTVRNIDDSSSSMGYGLIFHSDPTPLTQDYAFLIDTKKKRYRVVKHAPAKETVVIPWTNSPKIKDGSVENLLEARDNGDDVDLYINGDLIKTVKGVDAPSSGVPGVYSGDQVRAAFSKLEIRK
jgi:hypothetical protein